MSTCLVCVEYAWDCAYLLARCGCSGAELEETAILGLVFYVWIGTGSAFVRGCPRVRAVEKVRQTSVCLHAFHEHARVRAPRARECLTRRSPVRWSVLVQSRAGSVPS
eukprot:3775440-Lingulodinium_polyedra.AAC.2